MYESLLSRYSPHILSVLRIIVGFLYIEHGASKLFGFPVEAPMAVTPMSLMWLAGLLEFFGGLLIMVGFVTRPVAFLLSGEMAIAYFMMHAPQNFWPLINHGELAVLYCFSFLYLSMVGPGPWSLDHLWLRGKIDQTEKGIRTGPPSSLYHPK
jgi:putative oxidoreductase